MRNWAPSGNIDDTGNDESQQGLSTPPAREWDQLAEFDLLGKYLSARNDPEKATEKGIQLPVWQALRRELNEKHKRQLGVSTVLIGTTWAFIVVVLFTNRNWFGVSRTILEKFAP